MKVSIKKLKKIIKETINEIQGTSGTRGGIAVPGSSNEYNQDVWFPGHDNDYKVIRKGFDDEDERMGQGIASPSGSYVNGVGWVDDNGDIWHGTYKAGKHTSGGDLGDQIDDSMPEGSRNERDFFLVIDSQVTRGKAGDIISPQDNQIFTVQQDTTKGTLAGDLYWKFQSSANKSAKARAKDVISILMDNQLLQKEVIDDGLLDEFGIRGRDSKKIYGIVDYFAFYNNAPADLKESKRRRRRK